MSILHNAYQSYLESKYEKEIKEFQDFATKNIEEYIEECKKIINYKIKGDEYTDLEEWSDMLRGYVDILNIVKLSPLTIELEWLEEFKLTEVIVEYDKLESVIIEGEQVKGNYDSGINCNNNVINFSNNKVFTNNDELIDHLWRSGKI